MTDLKFKDGATVNLSNSEGLPVDLDVSNCAKIDLLENDLSVLSELKFKDGVIANLAYCKNLPKNLDVSNCAEILLNGCDLGNIKNLKIKDGANVNLSYCSNLPKNLDLSNCGTINLSGLDLNNIKNLKFKDGAEVDFSACINVPENIDVSTCSCVNFNGCDLSKIENLKLKDGVEISFTKTKKKNVSGYIYGKLPQNFDTEKCAVLNLRQCDLSKVNNLKFRKDSEISIMSCENIPNNLDVSQCKEVWVNTGALTKIKSGNAHVVASGIGGQVFDFSTTKNLSVPDMTEHKNFGMAYTSLLNAKEMTFKDKAQYRDLVIRPNIGI